MLILRTYTQRARAFISKRRTTWLDCFTLWRRLELPLTHSLSIYFATLLSGCGISLPLFFFLYLLPLSIPSSLLPPLATHFQSRSIPRTLCVFFIFFHMIVAGAHTSRFCYTKPAGMSHEREKREMVAIGHNSVWEKRTNVYCGLA